MANKIIPKRCSKCKQTKSLTEFPKDRTRKDGYYCWCKSCNIDHVKQYQKTVKSKEAHRKASIRYRQSEKGKTNIKLYRQSKKGKVARKRYQQSDKGKANKSAIGKRFRVVHPERCKAKTAVRRVVESGKLPRPDSFQCHYCPTRAKQYHHHKGYEPEYWLDVIPVCAKCHNILNHCKAPRISSLGSLGTQIANY